MELAWKGESLTVKKAIFGLRRIPPPAYTTIMTTLARLTDKGLLKRVKDGRQFVYKAAIDRETFLSERIKMVHDCLNHIFESSK